MKLVIKYKDENVENPKAIMTDNNKVKEIHFNTPFLTIGKTIVKKNGNRELEILIGNTKKCIKCGKECTPDQFYNSSSARDGKQNTCIACKKKLDTKQRRKIIEEKEEQRKNMFGRAE